MRVFDTHVHYPFGPPGSDPTELAAVDHLAQQCHKVDVVKVALLSRRGREGYDYALRARDAYPDLFIPFAFIDLDQDGPETVNQVHGLGFRGLKCLGPQRNYDDPSYFPIYAEAERLGLVILFHMGVLGGPIDYLATHPRRDPTAMQRFMQWQERMGPRNISANRMNPIYLDTLANNFPRLKLIGAHMGGTGWYDLSCSVARWRPYVYFDISGGAVIRRHVVEQQIIGKEMAPEKLLFGSDSGADRIGSEIEEWQAAFDRLGLSQETRELIMYRNAAEIFGLAD